MGGDVSFKVHEMITEPSAVNSEFGFLGSGVLPSYSFKISNYFYVAFDVDRLPMNESESVSCVINLGG